MDVDPVAVSGVWWRHVRADLAPTKRPPDPADGRWQTGDVIEAVYFGEKPETVWAEGYRFVASTATWSDLANR